MSLKVNLKYLWDWNEMFFTKQLKDGECNGDNYLFLKYLKAHLKLGYQLGYLMPLSLVSLVSL